MAPQRKLVTIRPITQIRALPGKRAAGGARLEVATVGGGWAAVVPKDEFRVGQLVLYFEVDAFIPAAGGRLWEWSNAYSRHPLDGELGYRVASRVVGRQLSQGLVLRREAFPEVGRAVAALEAEHGPAAAAGMSFEALLGVRKWEERPACAAGPTGGDQTRSLGRPPVFFRQPGCERVQNLPQLFTDRYLRTRFQVTEKLDGASMTVYRVAAGSRWHEALPALPEGPAQQQQQTRDAHARIGVCSRDADLDADGGGGGVFWEVARRLGIPEKMHRVGRNVAVQGELVGHTIGKNSLGFGEGEHGFYVFEMYDIDKQAYMGPEEVVRLCEELGLPHAPVIGYFKLEDFATSLKDILQKAEGLGMRGQVREGLVFRSQKDDFIFKVISNSWLLTQGE